MIRTQSRRARVLSDDEVGVCNCAACRRQLVGERTQAVIESGEARLGAEFVATLRRREVRFVAHRDKQGRPFCKFCTEKQ
jgi:hypothetical protein